MDLFGGFAVDVRDSELYIEIVFVKCENKTSASLIPNQIWLGISYVFVPVVIGVGSCAVQLPCAVWLVHQPLVGLSEDDFELLQFVVQLIRCYAKLVCDLPCGEHVLGSKRLVVVFYLWCVLGDTLALYFDNLFALAVFAFKFFNALLTSRECRLGCCHGR